MPILFVSLPAQQISSSSCCGRTVGSLLRLPTGVQLRERRPSRLSPSRGQRRAAVCSAKETHLTFTKTQKDDEQVAQEHRQLYYLLALWQRAPSACSVWALLEEDAGRDGSAPTAERPTRVAATHRQHMARCDTSLIHTHN